MNGFRRGIGVLLAGWTLVCTSGCASLISGTHQTLDIKAQPPGTQVTVYRWNGEVIAGPIAAPASTSVHRPKWNHPYLAVASKEGTCPRYWVPTTSLSPGGWVDMIAYAATLGVGEFASVMIDTSNGSEFKLDASEFNNIALQEQPCAH